MAGENCWFWAYFGTPIAKITEKGQIFVRGAYFGTNTSTKERLNSLIPTNCVKDQLYMAGEAVNNDMDWIYISNQSQIQDKI